MPLSLLYVGYIGINYLTHLVSIMKNAAAYLDGTDILFDILVGNECIFNEPSTHICSRTTLLLELLDDVVMGFFCGDFFLFAKCRTYLHRQIHGISALLFPTHNNSIGNISNRCTGKKNGQTYLHNYSNLRSTFHTHKQLTNKKLDSNKSHILTFAFHLVADFLLICV